MSNSTDTSTIIIYATVISAVITALSQVISSLMPIILEKFKHKKMASKKTSQFEKTLSTSIEVRTCMEKLLEIATIDRVTLWSLSNGTSVFKNTHLWNLQFYDEVSVPSVLSTKDLLRAQKLNLSYFSDAIDLLKLESVILFTDSSGLENRVARELTTGSGTKSMYITLVKDIHGLPIGLLISESVHSYIESADEKHTSLIKDMAIRLSLIL